MPKTMSDKISAGTCSPPECISDRRRTVLRITLAAFAVLLLFLFAVAPASADDFFPNGGDGTANNPFNISSPKDLQNLSIVVNGAETYSGGKKYNEANYTLTCDLNLDSVCGVGGNSWTPIGTYTSSTSKAFKGTFNGSGHTISDLYINNASADYQGLFGYTSNGATIKNLGLVNVNVTGLQNVGGLAGLNEGTNTKIENCSAAGNVTGGVSVGGLVGWNQNGGTIKNCSATGNVTGKGNYVGGLVGWNQNGGTIKNCSATGNVTGKGNYVGGLVGKNEESGTITNCYATVTVTGNDWVGGLVGKNEESGTITNCSAAGKVEGSSYLGGLVGENYASSGKTAEITNCSAAGDVEGTRDYVGGLVGKNYAENSGTAEIKNCYATGKVEGNNQVGGLVGWNYAENSGTATATATATIIKSVALNQFVLATGDNVGRVVGQNYAESGTATITNCYAWEDMILSTAGNYDGASVSSSDIWWKNAGEGVWGSGMADFDTDVWVKNSGNEYYKLPVLKDSGGNIRADTVSDAAYLSITQGSGTAANPYNISSPAQLHGLALLVNAGNTKYNEANYTLTNGFSLSTVCNATSGTSWTPIGTESAKFKGTFDGNNNTISKLYIDVATNFQGLFGYTEGSTIRNLGLKDVNVTGKGQVGGLAGQNNIGGNITNCNVTGNVTGTGTDYLDGCVGGLVGVNNAKIENCYSAGNITGVKSVGGLVGQNGGIIENCYSTGAVEGTGDNVGGLVGYIDVVNAKITNCYSTGAVEGTGDNVGGFVGQNNRGTIENCYSAGSVTSTGTKNYVGGLVGKNGGTIENCYSTGAVTGYSNVGGFAGQNYGDNAKIENCYSTGAVTGYSNVGGLVGKNGKTTKNSTALNQFVNGSSPIGRVVGNAGGTISDNYAWEEMLINGKTVSQSGNNGENKTLTNLTNQSTYETLGWVFPNTWVMGGSVENSNTAYPILKWQTKTVTFNSSGGSDVDSKYVMPNTPVRKPADPTRTGFAFAGWHTDSGTLYDFATPVTEDITLYANWTTTPIQSCTVDIKFDESKGIVTCDRPMVKSGDKYVISNIPYNSELTFTFTPSIGNTVEDVKLNGASKSAITTLKLIVQSANTIEVEFGTQPTKKPAETKTVEAVVPPETKEAGVEEAEIILDKDDPVDQEVKVSAQITEPEKDFGEIPSNQDVKVVVKIDAKYQPVNGIATVSLKVDKDKISSPNRVKVFHNVFDAASNEWIQNPVNDFKITLSGDFYIIEFTTATFSYFSVTETKASSPSSGGGSGEDTGSGNYKEYLRHVTDGGVVDFGSSPVVSKVELPKGSKGDVKLVVDKTGEWDLSKDSEYGFDISVTELGEGTSKIIFKVPKSKLDKNDIGVEDLAVYHEVDGQWVKLKVEYEVKDDGYVYYTAYTDSFSPFKMVIEENGAEPVVKEPTQPVVTSTATQTAEPEQAPAEPVTTAVPTAEQTKSPIGLVGLVAGLGMAALALRRR